MILKSDQATFFYKPTITEMFFKGHMYFSGSDDRYDTTKYLELFTSTSLGVTGLDLQEGSPPRGTAFTYGDNAAPAGNITAGAGAGGLWIVADGVASAAAPTPS